MQANDQPGGIGVAVADKPAGPFRDALGKLLIGQFHNGAQPIDQFVFRDDDGQFYLYYGGWGHCNVVRLGDDLTSIEPFPDGETYKEITPPGYVEGSFLVRSEEHTSELQSLMRISYAVFCLKKTTNQTQQT